MGNNLTIGLQNSWPVELFDNLYSRPDAIEDLPICSPFDFVPHDSYVSEAGIGVTLNITDRQQDQGRPKSGWCGEDAIQMALMYYGSYYPQQYINSAGSPQHPDLYGEDIPFSLTKLGALQVWWPERQLYPIDRFLRWISYNIMSGHPVIAGVKINPSKHPEWSADHFVLVVGADEIGLTLNTTWGFQTKRTFEQLKTFDAGIGVENPFFSYYAVSISGLIPSSSPQNTVTRLFPFWESSDQLGVIVKCEHLVHGAEYVYSKSGAGVETGGKLCKFKADQSVFVIADTISKEKSAIYNCIPLE